MIRQLNGTWLSVNASDVLLCVFDAKICICVICICILLALEVVCNACVN
jgi:hypothetical protein